MYSLESPNRDHSNEYTQYTIISWNIESTSLKYPHLTPDLALSLTLNGSNYPCLEQISITLIIKRILSLIYIETASE